MDKIFKNLAIYLLIVLLTVAFIKLTSPTDKPVEEWTVTRFYEAIEEGQIKEVTLIPYDNIIKVKGVLKNNVRFTTNVPSSAGLTERLIAHKITTKTQLPPQTPWWANLLGSLLPLLLLLGLFFFLLQQTQGGGSKVMQFGKSRARLVTADKRRVTFNDVAGVDEAKEELQEVVEFLKNPRKFNELGARIPKGVLLYGPPGTGKTLLAKAVAGEAGVPFFSISGSDFVEMFVGVGASRVRDLFEQAKRNAPCIVFIDEIDAVGRQRGAGLGGGHDEREQTLNQLLVEMDGFNANEGIIVIAATNRPDILDPALLRPGRFDRQIMVDIPDIEGRKAILKVHLRGKPLEEDVDLEVLARRTPGFTGADLANMVNEAALLAARRNKRKIGIAELEEAIERIIAGPEKKSRVMSDYEKKLVAYHEAGHAVVSYYLPNADPLHKVSIIPRGHAGGYTLLLPKEDRRYLTKSQILDQVTMLLGGRVAEELVLEEISTGAHNDLERATDLIRKMITEFGMSEELGPLTFGRRQDTVFLGRDITRDRNYSEAIAFAIDKEARKIIDSCYERAKKILQEHLEELHRVAQALMERETLEAAEFEAVLKEEMPQGKGEQDQSKKSLAVNPQPSPAPAFSNEPRLTLNWEQTRYFYGYFFSLGRRSCWRPL
ncbi:MAG TPA: ATP-dependent metallopeptidase FtsH/Yme1/Tma family protein [Moorella mulderi]|nr:ATP-dependent metallopeptidase FtsH/Yme1/Tma family protein [Moorella mulderi]